MTDRQDSYRRECEARTVLSWPFEKRKPYLDLVEKHRGSEARKYLEQEIIKQHKLAKKEGT